MGKNLKGGKHKSQKNNGQTPVIKLDEIKPDNIETFIGSITKACGNKRFIALIICDNIEIPVKLAGSVRARISINDYVMVQKAENLGGCNAYILHKYSDAEISALKIKNMVKTIKGSNKNDDDNCIDFSFDDI